MNRDLALRAVTMLPLAVLLLPSCFTAYVWGTATYRSEHTVVDDGTRQVAVASTGGDGALWLVPPDGSRSSAQRLLPLDHARELGEFAAAVRAGGDGAHALVTQADADLLGFDTYRVRLSLGDSTADTDVRLTAVGETAKCAIDADAVLIPAQYPRTISQSRNWPLGAKIAVTPVTVVVDAATLPLQLLVWLLLPF